VANGEWSADIYRYYLQCPIGNSLKIAGPNETGRIATSASPAFPKALRRGEKKRSGRKRNTPAAAKERRMPPGVQAT